MEMIRKLGTPDLLIYPLVCLFVSYIGIVFCKKNK